MRADSNPLVSVIVPIYDVEAYLEQALSSIQEQTYENLEVICLNDGSADSSPQIIQRFASKDKRFIVVNKQNEGYGATCNLGLSMARGEWIAIVEPDDWILPDMYASMLEKAARFEREGFAIDIVKTPYWRIIDPDTSSERKLPCRYKGKVRAKKPFKIEDELALFRFHPSIWSALYNARFIKEHDLRFHEIPGAGWADTPFFVDTLLAAKNIIYLDKAFYCYREETPEKVRKEVLSDPTMPFERWKDMDDSLRRMEIDDQRAWDIHYARAFSYLRRVLPEVGMDDRSVHDAVVEVFSRMDPQRVFDNPEIAPHEKRMFANAQDLPAPKIKRLDHIKVLARGAVDRLRNEGAASVIQSARRMRKRR